MYLSYLIWFPFCRADQISSVSSEKDQLISEQEETISNKDKELSDKDSAIQTLEDEIKDKEEYIHSVEDSIDGGVCRDIPGLIYIVI